MRKHLRLNLAASSLDTDARPAQYGLHSLGNNHYSKTMHTLHPFFAAMAAATCCMTAPAAFAQCVQKPEQCPAGTTAVVTSACYSQNAGTYLCKPSDTPFISTVTLAKPSAVLGGHIDVSTTGNKSCIYGFGLRDGGGNKVAATVPSLKPASMTSSVDLALFPNLKAGAYQFEVETPTGNNECDKIPLPVPLTLLDKPYKMMAEEIGIHGKDQAQWNPPFYAGQPMIFGIYALAKMDSCLVNVVISGPDTQVFNGTLLEWLKPHDFTVSKPGKYTLNLVTSPSAPPEQACTGGPVAKSFDVLAPGLTPGAVQNVLVPAVTLPKGTPVKPAGK